MTNYCIIDDEPIAHRIIEGYAADLPYLNKVGNAFNAFEASDIISKQPVDLIFLDINMPRLTGFEWLKTLSNPPQIIVTTAYKEFAIEGYELDIVDYLLKPFSLPRFLKAINKARTVDTTNPTSPQATIIKEHKSLFIKGDKKHHQIHTADILFIEAAGNYSKIYLSNEMILSHDKISSLERILDSNHFLRVHKSFIIATNKVKLIQGNQITIRDHKVPIGQTYRNGVNALLSGR